MKYAGGGIVRHLGLQNYKGSVPALAELIANAWDADATEVHVKVPLDVPITLGHTIVIKDNGTGMTYNDCDNKYLVIGRNRRIAENTEISKGGRQLMAHKGLGKLAGFGIAEIVEVKTIKAKKLTHFIMYFKKIDCLEHGEPYQPEMIADEEYADEPDGTEITLKRLSLINQIPKDTFLRSMASRFAVLSNRFNVYINGELLCKKQIPVILHFPEKIEGDVLAISNGWGKTKLQSGDEITWWIGFTEKPIQVDGVQGVSVITRGRISQDPWDFGLSSGGTHNQWGLRYMTGEIIADFLDQGLEKDGDLVITNRSNILWDHPKARPLYEWARERIKELVGIYFERKAKRTVEEIKKEHPAIVEKINQFQPREQKELNEAMLKIAEVPTIEPEKLATICEYVIDGYKDRAFTSMIEEIKQMPPEERVKTLELLKEFDILEAVRIHKLVSAHIQVIQAFRRMIDAGVPEKPDMHEHIMKYPWFLGIKRQAMSHELSLERILEEKFGIQMTGDSGKKRPDFFCMRGGSDVLVIELKRPGEAAGKVELTQIADYVDILRDWVQSGNPERLTGLKINPENIEGFLIAYDYQNDPTVDGQMKRLEDAGIHCCKWYDLLQAAEDDQREYLEVVKSRAPKQDPRIKELEEKKIV